MDPVHADEELSWQQSCTYLDADATPVAVNEDIERSILNYDIPVIGSVTHDGRKLTLHYSGRNAVEQPIYESDVIGQESAIDLKHPFLRLSAVGSSVDGDAHSMRRAFEGFIRRVLDVTMSALLVVVLSPVLLVLALIVKLDSKGPVLFSQRRVGKDQDIFTLYKFRSMVIDAEQRKVDLLKFNEATGPIFKIKQDPRITNCGRWMRRLSLDELPQLFNVLRGDMSFVGPRPALPSEVAEYNTATLQRLSVKPGITGLSQVSGRSDLSFERSVRHDLEYINHQCLWLDFLIVLRTIKVVLLGHGAY
jgi:exopolysaccharide biosynthesis polyprenyl glycosylphosphotransferase